MASHDDFTLDAKYRLEEGTIFLSGIQALVRLPLDQHRADTRRGVRTATLISGYRSSPLGGLDLTLERNPKLLADHDVVFISGLNEDLGATAIYGAQLANMFPKPKYDGVLGMWYGKGPGVDRTGDIFKHANYAGIGRWGGALALAVVEVVHAAHALGSRPVRRVHAHAVPRQRAGDSRPRALRVRDVALLRAMGRLQDRDERRR